MLGLFKKKKPESLPELPPPPSPPPMAAPMSDIPPIQPAEGPAELPEFPTAPSMSEGELPEVPTPEFPEVPKPEDEQKAFDDRPELYEKPELVPVEEHEVQVFDRTIATREVARRPVGPAFVSVDEYRNILEHSNRVRAKLMEADEFVRGLNDIKVEEARTFERWRSQLEDIERKLTHVDRVIAKAQR